MWGPHKRRIFSAMDGFSSFQPTTWHIPVQLAVPLVTCWHKTSSNRQQADSDLAAENLGMHHKHGRDPCFFGDSKKSTLPTSTKNNKPRWWFQIFFNFIPIWGRFPLWLIFFSDGSKPPTRKLNTTNWSVEVNERTISTESHGYTSQINFTGGLSNVAGC